MKKFIFFYFIIILLLTSCSLENSFLMENVDSVSVVSSITNQIQHKDDLRLDKIILKLEYNNNQSQHVTLKDEYITNKLNYDKCGLINLNINIGQASIDIPLFIYDDFFLAENYIYYYKVNDIYTIDYANDILQLKIPKNNDLYFYGWYQDVKKTKKYYDSTKRIVEIFPAWASHEVCQVDFFIDDYLVETQYVFKGQPIKYPQVDSDFFCWIPQSNSESIITDYTKIYGYTNNFHMCIIRVFDIDNDFVNYFIVEKGSKFDYDIALPPTHKFIRWSEDTTCVVKNLDLYPIVERVSYEVRFISSLNNEVIQKDYVSYNGTAVFDYDSCNYRVVSFSKPLTNIVDDVDIIVTLDDFFYYYYVSNHLFYVSKNNISIPLPPINKYYYATWEKVKDKKYIFEAKYTPVTFHIKIDNDEEIILNCDDDSSFNFNILKQTKTLKLYNFDYASNGSNFYPEGDYRYTSENIYLIATEYLQEEYLTEIFDLTQLNGFSFKTNNYKELIIAPKFFPQLNITKIQLSSKFSGYTIFLDDSDFILNVTDISQSYFIIDKNNPNYYSDDNGFIYEKSTINLIYGG